MRLTTETAEASSWYNSININCQIPAAEEVHTRGPLQEYLVNILAGALPGGAIQTTFAALSFAGAGFLFNKLNHTGYEKEIKRHNLSLEKLAAAKEAFYENEIRHKDRLAQLRADLSDANHDINDTNKALDKLSTYTSGGVTLRGEPMLGDFYKPSEEMQKYQSMFAAIVGVGVGFTAHRLGFI